MPNDDISIRSLHIRQKGNAPHEFACSTSPLICTPYVLESEQKLQRLQSALDNFNAIFLLDKIQNTPNEKEEFIVVGLASILVAVELPSVTPRVDISYTALDVLWLSAVISWMS